MKKISLSSLLKKSLVCLLPLIASSIVYMIMWSPQFVNHENFGILTFATPINIIIFLFLSMLLSMYALSRVALREHKVYKEQNDKGALNKMVLADRMGFWEFGVYFVSFTGSLVINAILIGVCESVFGYHEITRVIAFLVCFAGLFAPIACFDSVTGYKIISIPFSEFELFSTGSKELNWFIDAMIYGDKNSDENLKIINNVVLVQKEELKTKILKTKEKEQEQKEKELELFKNDPFKELKLRLTAFKN